MNTNGSVLFNNGRPWDLEQDLKIADMFTHGSSLPTICVTMGRSASSICSRLARLGYLKYNSPEGYKRKEDDSLYTTNAGMTDLTDAIVSGKYTLETTSESVSLSYSGHATFKPTEKELTMNNFVDNTKAVSTVTYVYGQPVDSMSDDQIFNLIAKIEQEIESLSKIKAQSKKLEKKVASLKDDINKLVELVDNR